MTVQAILFTNLFFSNLKKQNFLGGFFWKNRTTKLIRLWIVQHYEKTHACRKTHSRLPTTWTPVGCPVRLSPVTASRSRRLTEFCPQEPGLTHYQMFPQLSEWPDQFLCSYLKWYNTIPYSQHPPHLPFPIPSLHTFFVSWLLNHEAYSVVSELS